MGRKKQIKRKRKDAFKQREEYSARINDITINVTLFYSSIGGVRNAALNVIKEDDSIPVYSAWFDSAVCDCEFEVWACYEEFKKAYVENYCTIPDGWCYFDQDNDEDEDFGFCCINDKKGRLFDFMSLCFELNEDWVIELKKMAKDGCYGIAYAIHWHDLPHVHILVKSPVSVMKEKIREDFDFLSPCGIQQVASVKHMLRYMADNDGVETRVFVVGKFSEAAEFAKKQSPEVV